MSSFTGRCIGEYFVEWKPFRECARENLSAVLLLLQFQDFPAERLSINQLWRSRMIEEECPCLARSLSDNRSILCDFLIITKELHWMAKIFGAFPNQDVILEQHVGKSSRLNAAECEIEWDFPRHKHKDAVASNDFLPCRSLSHLFAHVLTAKFRAAFLMKELFQVRRCSKGPWNEYPWNEFYFVGCCASCSPVRSKGNLYLLWGLRNMNKKSLLVEQKVRTEVNRSFQGLYESLGERNIKGKFMYGKTVFGGWA